MIHYSDSEVKIFHPICEHAIKQALRQLRLDTVYQPIHHRKTGSLEMDYVIENISTKKYLCVVEVKRTPAAVNSTRYQFQAMSYVQNNIGVTEKPFYILTNLELAYSFRHDTSRPSAYQQILEPGLEKISDFTIDNESAVRSKLADYFKHKIQDFIANNYIYQLNLAEFVQHMSPLIGDSKKWKTHLAVLLYEYIRGAFSHLSRNSLKDIRILGNNVQLICNEASRVDFKGIYDYTATAYLPTLSIPNNELINLFNLGDQNISGDSIANVLHSLVSSGHEHEGEVATDIELARLVAALAKTELGAISPSDVICDPAAGSGNLISSAIEIMGLTPPQLMANDINPKLLELLSLRLGLNFASTISPTNAPIVLNKDITTMSRSDFSNVKVVLMNPPYVAGINCVNRKQPFFTAIHKLSGKRAVTNKGQMPLESVFLELITELVPQGTVLACVFPSNFLTASGEEAKVTRSLILSQFGLRTIFTYPGDEIFESVTKSTCVLIGRSKMIGTRVNVISSYTKIPDIDIHQFAACVSNTFGSNFATIMPGIQAKSITTTTLVNSIYKGWMNLNQEKQESIDYINQFFKYSPKFSLIQDLSIPKKRGTVGNDGGSDLLFLSDTLYNKYAPWGLRTPPAIRNSTYDKFIVGMGDSKFLDTSINPPLMIDSIISDFILQTPKKKKQTKKSKTLPEWRDIALKANRTTFPPNSVLIPRGIRAFGSAYVTDNTLFVSTNFYVCTYNTAQDARIVGTWLTTIFYQLMCEIFSKNENGLRKMEVADIKKTYIPDLSSVSSNTITQLLKIVPTIDFVDLRNPQIRDVDKIWANELFGTNAINMLNDAQRLLAYLANIRES